MTTKLYDHEFFPWRIDGAAHSGRVIDGREWNQLPEVTS